MHSDHRKLGPLDPVMLDFTERGFRWFPELVSCETRQITTVD